VLHWIAEWYIVRRSSHYCAAVIAIVVECLALAIEASSHDCTPKQQSQQSKARNSKRGFVKSRGVASLSAVMVLSIAPTCKFVCFVWTQTLVAGPTVTGLGVLVYSSHQGI
jgi:hypothetical protein